MSQEVDPTHARGADPLESEDEYRLKAALVYNFVKYTEWPSSAFEDDKTPLTIRVVGKDPFGEKLDTTFEDKRLHGRKIVIERSAKVPETVAAHVVYVGKLDKEERKALLELSAGRPTMVIGEREGLARAGATVNFYLVEEKVRFEINVDAAEDSELVISSELLKLARIIRNEEDDR